MEHGDRHQCHILDLVVMLKLVMRACFQKQIGKHGFPDFIPDYHHTYAQVSDYTGVKAVPSNHCQLPAETEFRS